MCLAIPAKIIKINKNLAEVESMGIKKEVDITLVPDAVKGDYVIVHAGFAIQIIDKKEAANIENYFNEYFDGQKH
ncbi:MAG: HypC/HybG/HupF family hydrogenase formation chaperone [Candidatus Humimicrobiaceae bacterium]|jgi:hydrogenase expression/formation protein HypC|nr:HypC/HybG/HupF family hydrogenase formation chaperone [Actinomycetota bacterium]MDD5600687.1 HypC/HybG/HupF family hydrogenase formation chaperone [Actinomycetota bacterium]MDY0027827.1 HypC/HybG/HupF family hydrogenase formation chaperone [Candidatus Humimicrobiaceae bacterium]